jgi:hypothetical protein
MVSLALGAMAILASAVRADSLQGASVFLCSSLEATQCTPGADCVSEAPYELNIPQFVEVDLDAKQVRTTVASGERRATPIRFVDREGGTIFLQGVEDGRAFSFVIVEESGWLTASVARADAGVTVFGACTPLAVKHPQP